MSNIFRKIRTAVKIIIDPAVRFDAFNIWGLNRNMPDDKYLKKQFKFTLGRELDLENPQTLCEKIQWLKLYDRRPEYVNMVDKYEVKKLVADKIGSQYVVPLLGVWDKFDDIDFDTLPDQFILKCTHDSGGFVVCTDKAKFDKEAAKNKLEASLKQNYFTFYREWVYKHVKPRIIAEEYIPTLGKPDSVEYKLSCFNGVAKLITLCRGIAHSSYDVRTNDHYDRDFHVYYKNSTSNPPAIPPQMDEIINISEKLSAGIPYVRVDSYIHNNKVYFGEITFYTWSGLMVFDPPEWDYTLGSWVELPKEKHISD